MPQRSQTPQELRTRTSTLGLFAFTVLSLAGCGAATSSHLHGCSGAGCSTVVPQIVYMIQPNGSVTPPGPQNTAWEIGVMNVDGSNRRQLTNDRKFHFLPHFSPDGSKIAYAKYTFGGYGDPSAQPDVFVYNLATAKETQLTFDGNSVQPVWSPDGRRILYGEYRNGMRLHIMKADGSAPTFIAGPSGAPDDLAWGDFAWSSDNWILFTVNQNINGCFKVRTDKMRPDGSARTQVSDGGSNCTPAGFEQSGDADPGWSRDAKTIYSSRGFPVHPRGTISGTERKLYAFSSGAWYSGKRERDLSLPSEPDCIEGVPKGSPDGTRVLLFRICFDTGQPRGGIYVTDSAGKYRRFITAGFGADWNPKWKR
jgi:Tol biopolymer transport system component